MESVSTTFFIDSDENQKQFSGRNLSSVIFLQVCDEGNEVLQESKTLELDTRFRKIAHDLGDTKILAKLREGDMVAIEAKYHRKFTTHTPRLN